jgi:hypothetical protein
MSERPEPDEAYKQYVEKLLQPARDEMNRIRAAMEALRADSK